MVIDVQNDFIAPTMSTLVFSDLTSSGVTITWKTSKDTNTLFEYGTDMNYTEWIVSEDIGDENHQIVLKGLNPDTKYYFIAYSQDAAGNEVNSGQMEFTTTP
jgi:hypothetical protein